MITEIAHLTIEPADAEKFEDAVAKASGAFRDAEGCYGMVLERVIEHTGQYQLRVQWKSVDDHLIGFRNSAGFQVWRGLVGSFFSATPQVEHSEVVAKYF